jgi:hypothetical protein
VVAAAANMVPMAQIHRALQEGEAWLAQDRRLTA